MGTILAAIGKWIIGPIAGPIFVGLSIALSLGWIATTIVDRAQIAEVRADRDQLKSSIFDPSTGYVARNAQCETNVAGLTVGLDAARSSIQKLADDTTANNRSIRALMAGQAAIAGNVKASADKLLALPAPAPVGSIEACTAGARVLKRGTP